LGPRAVPGSQHVPMQGGSSLSLTVRRDSRPLRAGDGSRSGIAKCLGRLIAICMFMMISLSGLGAEPGLVNPPAKPLETNGQETVRSYLLLQEQLHATQLAIE